MKAISEEQQKKWGMMALWVALAGIGLWVVYTYILGGLYLGPRDTLAKAIEKARQNGKSNELTVKQAAQASKVWAGLSILDQTTDPNARDSTGAEVSDAYAQAARNAGITFASWSDAGTHASSGHPDFVEIKFTASANTTTARLARFLYAIETNSTIPARIDDLSVHSRQPGVDSLHAEMSISALIYNPKLPIASRPAGSRPATQGGKVPAGVTATRTLSGSVAPEPAADPAAVAALMAKRQAERDAADKEAAKKEAEAAAFAKLTPEQQAAELTKIRAAKEEADKKAQAEQEAAAKKLEEAMILKRQQELGAPATNAGGAK